MSKNHEFHLNYHMVLSNSKLFPDEAAVGLLRPVYHGTNFHCSLLVNIENNLQVLHQIILVSEITRWQKYFALKSTN